MIALVSGCVTHLQRVHPYYEDVSIVKIIEM